MCFWCGALGRGILECWWGQKLVQPLWKTVDNKNTQHSPKTQQSRSGLCIQRKQTHYIKETLGLSYLLQH